MNKNLKNLLAAFYDNTPNPIEVINEKGELIYFNNKYSALFGVNTETTIDYNIFTDNVIKRNGIDLRLKNCFLTKENFQIENYSNLFLKRNHTAIPVINTTVVFLEFENNKYLILCHFDNTEIFLANAEIKKAREMYRESERLKNSFLNTLSHEIRTPFNIILGYTTILKETVSDQLSADDQKLIIDLQEGSERLFRSLSQILEFAQIEAGNFKINIEPVNLIAILKSVIQNYEEEINDKNLSLKKTFATHSIMVDADLTCLNNALNNLMENAIKFTNQGFIEIETSVIENKNVAVCKIKDTGIGISQDYLNNLFSPFSQEDLSIGRPYEGNGLGLALSKKYIEKINGSILVDTIKGVGTTFTFTLPLASNK